MELKVPLVDQINILDLYIALLKLIQASFVLELSPRVGLVLHGLS